MHDAESDAQHVATGPASDPPDASAFNRVAIAHDYLNQFGGAERVVLELADMWPSAPIYTSLYRPQSTFPGFKGHEVHTSFLQRLPVDRGFRNLFPSRSSRPPFAAWGRLTPTWISCRNISRTRCPPARGRRSTTMSRAAGCAPPRCGGYGW